MNKKTLVITGSAGFIGFHLSLKLLKKGYQVIGIDNQINIKGNRIELDEITSCLTRYGIKKVHTIAFDNKIIAFYTDKKKYNQKLVDVFLKKNIPEYMVPHYLFHIKKFPLTRNTKLDINSLIKIAKKKLNA